MLLRDAHASPEERLRPSSRRKKGYDDYLVDGPLLGVGDLAEAPFKAMAAEDFKDEWVTLPSPHWAYACMKKVNFNIETVFQGETDALDTRRGPSPTAFR
jgi:hypothetical protein